MAAHVSAGIESASLLRKQRELFLSTVTVLAQAVEMRDQYTGGHTARVTEYSLLLATQLNLSPEELDLIRMGTPLHDIGKIGIEDNILQQAGQARQGRVRDHEDPYDQWGRRFSNRSATCIDHSHRPLPPRTLGRPGYPDGLKGDKIPRLARIVAVADAFDAMTSDRPYRPGLAADIAFAEVDKCKGKQFDPEAAAAFLSIHQRILQQMQSETKKIGLPVGGNRRRHLSAGHVISRNSSRRFSVAESEIHWECARRRTGFLARPVRTGRASKPVPRRNS